jgi:AcrR family transcriptional regulator
MGTVERKQKDFLKREKKFLEVAQRILLKEGYLGLSMEKIADILEYSTGTIYQHFKSKEDIIVALALETVQMRIDISQKASQFNGTTRERILAIGQASAMFYPQRLLSELILFSTNLKGKADPQRYLQYEEAIARSIDISAKIIGEAVENGDLVLSKGMNPAKMAYGLWSLVFGGFLLRGADGNLDKFGIENPIRTIGMHVHMLLDGWGWKPLFSEWDYQLTFNRIMEEVCLVGRK